MQTKPPVARNRRMTASTSPTDGNMRLASTSRAFPKSAVRSFYLFLVNRRVPISLILFSSILTAEAFLGIGWHHVNLQTDIVFGAANILVLLGLGIRSWAAGTIRKNSELATDGAYSLCRHPLYLGSFLMIVGFCLGTQPQINLLIVAPCVVVIYVCAIRSEEVKLAQLFGGAWTSYTATTPRLIPSLRWSRLRLSHWSVAQWRKNREYQAVLGTIAGTLGLLVWYVFG